MKFLYLCGNNIWRDARTFEFSKTWWVLNGIILLFDIGMYKKWSFIIIVGRIVDKETLEPTILIENGEYQWYICTFVDIGLDKKWSSIIFVERTFNKETLKSLDLAQHAECSITSFYF